MDGQRKTPVPDTILTRRVIDCAIEVHSHLGPGLLESVYEACLCEELAAAGLPFVRQCSMPVRYKGRSLDQSFLIDIIVDDTLVLEIKSVPGIEPLHEAQLLTYLRLSKYKLGLLLNFNAERLTDGIRRIANSIERIDEVWTVQDEPVWRAGRL
jgi:GxxExxY protein